LSDSVDFRAVAAPNLNSILALILCENGGFGVWIFCIGLQFYFGVEGKSVTEGGGLGVVDIIK
jgi:hypothetical protein